MNKNEKIEVFNVNNPGVSSFVQKDKYLEIKKVLLEFMPVKSPGLTQDEMAELVSTHVSDEIFEDRSKSGWWMKAVQLDLEARGILFREKCRPLRWYFEKNNVEIPLVAKEKQKIQKKPVYKMPDYIHLALIKNDLFQVYEERPFYQKNDYIGWITQAKREETRDKRLSQMLEELKSGNTYMNMDYKGKDGHNS